MPTTKATQPTNANAAPGKLPAASAWERARAHLEQLKAGIAGQINSYPSPIPACDAQFNYLLEQRGEITEELTRMEAARQRAIVRGDGDGDEALHTFIAASRFIDEAAGREIREGSL